VADLPKTAQAVGAFQTGDAARFLLPMPDVVRAGVLVRPTPRWLVEADVVVERWSTLGALQLLPNGITIESPNLGTAPKPLPPIVLPHNYEDAWSVRLGAEREVVPGRFTARAGVLRETSAVPLASTSIDFPNWERTAVSVGASVAIPGTPVTVDLAYAHHFLPARTVSNSVVAQVVTPCLTPGCTDPAPTVVGNGRYEASLDVVSISTRLAFGRTALDASATPP
jgi:long-subunit fatty acid transport protein